MSKEEIKRMADQTRDDIQRLMVLVELERKHLIGRLNQEMNALKAQFEKAKSEMDKLNDEKKSVSQAICKKFGHLYETNVYHKKIYANRLGYLSQGDVIQKCVCCGEIRHTTIMPCPNEGQVEFISLERKEATEQQLAPIEEKIKQCSLKLTNISHQMESVIDRYYDEICQVYGHSRIVNKDGKFICSSCGKEVSENETSFMEYLSKLINL